MVSSAMANSSLVGTIHTCTYIAAMNGVDAIVFTAGIGENGPDVREEICADMDYLGIAIL